MSLVGKSVCTRSRATPDDVCVAVAPGCGTHRDARRPTPAGRGRRIPGERRGERRAAPDAHAQARKLLRWHYLEPSARVELESFLASAPSTAAPPAWLASELVCARAYRTARSRGWLPSDADLKRVGYDTLDAFLDRELATLRTSLEAGDVGRCTLEELESMDIQEQADLLLLPVWQQMPAEARDAALLRAAFDSRRAEWDTAWQQRDRSMVYVDDAPTTRVLGSVAPRWYTEPQRAGQLQFLPNFPVRLVRNYTPAGQAYDPWKATFRVPLNVHKHTLRSFLLAVYGLRTTWARSMVYRSRVVFNVQKMRRTYGRDRTFKKVEVGLLEPFVFPGLSKEFLRTHLFSQEMMYEERRMMLKMTKGRRWRARKSIRGLSDAIDRNYAYQNAGAPDTQPGAKPTAQLLTRSGSIPTARHGNILAVLAERRKERLARVQQYIDEQKNKA
ncbi:hypothetical protein CBS14141_002724 [Malassezia furfur]|nr:hypothetical protein CBS14141_002724 [Malassezia furfur]